MTTIISKERVDELTNTPIDVATVEVEAMAIELSELRSIVVNDWKDGDSDCNDTWCRYCDGYLDNNSKGIKRPHSPDCIVLRYADYRKEVE